MSKLTVSTVSKLARRSLIPFVSALLIVGALGCRSTTSGDDDDDDDDDDDGGRVDDATIQEIRAESMPIGTAVNVRGVVVTAIDNFGDRKGNMYVMEPAGGPFSGLVVFLPGAEAAGFAVGDLIDIESAEKVEFALPADTSGKTLTELKAIAGSQIVLTKVGNDTVPEPELLDPRDLAADDDLAEQWESVLVRFDDVAVTQSPRTIDLPDDPNYDATFKEMRISGPFRVQSVLTELVDVTFVRDYCLTSMVGLIDYFFSYKLLPRSAEDIGAEGTGCLAPEASNEECADGLDNDADGFLDCEDFSCQANTVACVVDDYTIPEIQADTLPVGTPVVVRGVVVTAIDSFGARTGNMYVMDPAGGERSGIVVFLAPGEADGFAVGDLVDLEGGEKDEFALAADTSGRTITEIVPGVGGIVITKVGDGSVPAPQVLDPRALAADDAVSEAWESVLVRFENVAVTAGLQPVGATDPTFKEMRVTGPYRVQSVLTDLADPPLVEGYCMSAVTGVIDYFFDYKILPRTAADLGAAGDGCPVAEAGNVACGDAVDNDADGFIDCNDFSCDTATVCQ